MAEQVTPPEQQLELSEILQIRRDKLDRLMQASENPFLMTRFDRNAYAAQITGDFEQYEGKEVMVAGRVMSWRDIGKVSFMDLMDSSGKIQLYVRKDSIGEQPYLDMNQNWDIGDIVGATGEAFRTQRGEISVKVHKIELLSKSLLPLPEKFHGLKDTDTRYRQRYLDLIVNPDVRDTFVKRSAIIRSIRNYLDQRGFLEVETPVLHTMAGGASARPFITHHNTLDLDMYLRIALELHLKRLIIGGFDRVYEIGRVFRNEGMDVRHNPEFTLLELYEAYTDYNGMMDLIEDLFRQVTQEVIGADHLVCNDIEIDLGAPFQKMTMKESVKQYAGVDFDTITTVEQARQVAKEHHIEYEERHGKGDILNLFFEEFVEEKLVQPTFITQHPVEISPLAKRCPANPDYTERFELFILGREFANAFSELNDPIDQRQRFEHQAAMKAAGDDEASGVDEDFLTAMEYGMPPTGGLGLGIDRFVMLLTDSYSIRDVLLFPTMKPLNK